MLLSDISLSVCRVHQASVENREVWEDQNWHKDIPRHTRLRHHFQGQKVKVTRQLYSAQPLRVRWLQQSAWECIRCGKVLLRCICSAAHEALGRPRGRKGAGAYCVATRTAC